MGGGEENRTREREREAEEVLCEGKKLIEVLNITLFTVSNWIAEIGLIQGPNELHYTRTLGLLQKHSEMLCPRSPLLDPHASSPVEHYHR